MNRALTFDDVLAVPKYNKYPSRADVNPSSEIELGGSIANLTYKLPFMSSPMDTITGAEMAIVMSNNGALAIIHRFMSIEEMLIEWFDVQVRSNNPQNVGIAFGASDSEFERVSTMYEAGVRLFCLDIAHAHSKAGGQAIKRVKESFPDSIVIGGSVCTYAGADYMSACGADMIRVGIGGGSACSTRIQTGFGMPQFSAIVECVRCGKPVIADGGIRSPGDANKALGAGAAIVMMGGMLAGTTDTPGEVVVEDGKPFKLFRGMASKEVNDEYFGGLKGWKTAEGISAKVPLKGCVEDVLHMLEGGLRSGLTYCGAFNLKEFTQRIEFVEITHAGYMEGLPHIK